MFSLSSKKVKFTTLRCVPVITGVRGEDGDTGYPGVQGNTGLYRLGWFNLK